jgi:hypothetical protein
MRYVAMFYTYSLVILKAAGLIPVAEAAGFAAPI